MIVEFSDRRDELYEVLKGAGYHISFKTFHGEEVTDSQLHANFETADAHCWLPGW